MDRDSGLRFVRMRCRLGFRQLRATFSRARAQLWLTTLVDVGYVGFRSCHARLLPIERPPLLNRRLGMRS